MKYCFYLLLLPLFVFLGLPGRAEFMEAELKVLPAVPTVRPVPEPRFRRVKRFDMNPRVIRPQQIAHPIWRAHYRAIREYRLSPTESEIKPFPWKGDRKKSTSKMRNDRRFSARIKYRSRSPPI